MDDWISDRPSVVAHMNHLQGVVTRLAASSASCKTMCLTLVTALLTLAGTAHQPQVVHLVWVPILACWFLDVNYLAQETWFRKLYEAFARDLRDGKYLRKDVFLIKARAQAKADRELEAEVNSSGVLKAVKSWSTWPFYLGLLTIYGVAWRFDLLSALATAAK